MSISPLAILESQLRVLLPAHLYVAAWVEPTNSTLLDVFEHLRTLRYILTDYVPRQVADDPPQPGASRLRWQTGTLLFTDLAGFTRLMEANARQGRTGAAMLLKLLNTYFSTTIEIVSKSGGDLLEFTGDAMLVEFPAQPDGSDTLRAVRAGLRMQRAMKQFAELATPSGVLSLQMRVGIHTGRFLTADIGTPLRMFRVLLGQTVRAAKRAEGAGVVGRVCLTEAAGNRLNPDFHLEAGQPNYRLVIDDLSDERLGEYEIAPGRRRRGSTPLLLDRSQEALIGEIATVVGQLRPLASYLPQPVLKLLVENAAQRQIPERFPIATLLFVNFLGLSEAVDAAEAVLPEAAIATITRLFALINVSVTARGGVMKNPTYNLNGPDALIYFGAFAGTSDHLRRATQTAAEIRALVAETPPLVVGDRPYTLACQIGLNCGPIFTAEIGEARGRREFNVLGDAVNTASRVTSHATANQILLTAAVHTAIADQYPCEFLGGFPLKGKAAPTPIYALKC
ncbi:MAG: adenylate/guanylate cyclase domain-containing protein [Spirulinaceae cyanobacterium SM2_1_0]|nr:adenylate/guanylate cyclase domain-containing protein [Spirulinaceae cyanobacterium SM2_1_0]